MLAHYKTCEVKAAVRQDFNAVIDHLAKMCQNLVLGAQLYPKISSKISVEMLLKQSSIFRQFNLCSHLCALHRLVGEIDTWCQSHETFLA